MNNAQSACVQSARPAGKAWRRWLAAVLMMAAAAAAAGAYFFLWPAPPPKLPDLPDSDDHVLLAAMKEAQQEILRHPKSGPAWGHLGMLYFANSHFEQAVELFTEADKLDRNDFRWPYILGVLKFEQNKESVEALAYLQRAQALCKTNDMPAYRIALYHLANGKPAEGEKMLQDLLAATPDNGIVALALGKIAKERGDFGRALDYLHVASNLVLVRRDAYRFLSEVYFKIGQADKAELYQKGVNKFSDDMVDLDPVLLEASRYLVGRDVLIRRLDSFVRREAYNEAQEICEKIVREYPQFEVGHSHLGLVLVNLAQTTKDLKKKAKLLDQAEKHLHDAAAMNARNASTWFSLGLANQERGIHHLRSDGFRQAIANYDKCLALIPTDVLAMYNKACCLRDLGELPGAIGVFRQLAVQRPDFHVAYTRLAECLAMDGNVVEAFHFFWLGARETVPFSLEKSLAIHWLGKI